MKIKAVFVITAAIVLTACSATPQTQESSSADQQVVVPTPTEKPRPTPSVDPQCNDADTIVYVIERQKMWLSFMDLRETADAHIEKNNLKELRKDAKNAEGLKNTYEKVLVPPDFLRSYNEYMAAATTMYAQALHAHIDGEGDIEVTYLWGMASLLKKASDASADAWTYCRWVPEVIPFEPQFEFLPQ